MLRELTHVSRGEQGRDGARRPGAGAVGRRARRARPRAFAVLLTPAHAAELAAPAQPDVFRLFSLPQVGTFIAGECAAHDGFHLAEDAVLAEVVDLVAAPRPDGSTGRLLLSSLSRSLAVLRFDTGVTASLDRRPCACGEAHSRLHFA